MQEVSAFVDHKIGMKPQPIWRIVITNRHGIDAEWIALESEIQLVHEKSEQVLRVDGKRLPTWGYEQLQVAADHHMDEPGSVWVVEEHRHAVKGMLWVCFNRSFRLAHGFSKSGKGEGRLYL